MYEREFEEMQRKLLTTTAERCRECLFRVLSLDTGNKPCSESFESFEFRVRVREGLELPSFVFRQHQTASDISRQSLQAIEVPLEEFLPQISAHPLTQLNPSLQRDTIKAAFQALISVLKLPEDTDPLSFSLTDINIGLQASTSEQVRLSKEEYPGLCFRVRSDYDSFAILPEAQSMDHGKAPWLEQANGNLITADQLRAICASLRRAWAELVQHKLTPQTWTKISASGKSLVYKIMVKEHLLLGLDEDSFKLEMLCVNDYSGWCKNNLTPNGEWKEPSSKTEPKEEPKLECTDNVLPLAMKGKKCESDPQLVWERTKHHKASTSSVGKVADDMGGSQHEHQPAKTVPRGRVLVCEPVAILEDVPYGVYLLMFTSRSCLGSPTEAEHAVLIGLSSLSRHASSKNMFYLTLFRLKDKYFWFKWCGEVSETMRPHSS
ncbi:hypothetical protein BKA83DRAFT_4608279 [Pisolithus microcarpus]|nr:hypothetical protein BKA83DRAFT_4608279 [Pisolithus microcarpus]